MATDQPDRVWTMQAGDAVALVCLRAGLTFDQATAVLDQARRDVDADERHSTSGAAWGYAVLARVLV